MRWIFLSLVLMNTMFFTWRFLSPPVDVKREVAVAAVEPAELLAEETITMLEEVESEQATLREASPAVMEVSEGASNDKTSEMPAAVASTELAEVSSKAGLIEPSEQDLCYWIGGFADDDERQALQRRLSELRISNVSVPVPVSGGLRHWVYLPPRETRAEALGVVRTLKKLNIDSYMILEGEHRFGISLGLFSLRPLADKKIKDLRASGWEPAMDVFERTVNQYWLSVNKNDADRVGESVLPIMLKNKTNIQINEKKCH